MGNAVADLQPVLGLTYLGLGCSLTEMCYAVADLQPVLDLTWLGLQSYWKYDQDCFIKGAKYCFLMNTIVIVGYALADFQAVLACIWFGCSLTDSS